MIKIKEIEEDEKEKFKNQERINCSSAGHLGENNSFGENKMIGDNSVLNLEFGARKRVCKSAANRTIYLFPLIIAILFLSVSSVYANVPSTTLVSPADASANTGSATFSCTAIVTSGLVANITLYIWNASSGGIYNTYTQTFSVSSATLNQPVSGMTNGNYRWNCWAYDNSVSPPLSSWASVDRTFTVNRCGNGIIDSGTSEQCDNSSQNGVACVPSYNTNCTYCSAACANVTVQGGRCGDGACQSPNENSSTCLQDCPVSTCPSGMISYWKLDEGTGIIASDSFGSKNGILVNSPAWVDGKLGKALNFSATKYVNISDYNLLSGKTQVSIEAWVKSTDGAWNEMYLSINALNGLHLRSNALRVDGVSGGIELLTSPYPPANVWTHVVGTYDGATMKYYMNSILIGTQSFTAGALSSATNARIGLRQDGWGQMNGLIDEVAVYNRSLSASEIKKHYLNSLAGFDYCTVPRCGDGVIDAGEQCDDGNNVTGDRCSSTCQNETCPSGMVGYWNFNEGSGTTAYDSAGTHNGVFNSAPIWTSDAITGKALVFDGNDDSISLNFRPSDVLTIPKILTLEAWFKSSGSDQGQVIFGNNGGCSGDTQIYIALESGVSVLSFFSYAATWYNVSKVNAPSLNVWHHVVGIAMGGSPSYNKLYLDGVLVNTTTYASGSLGPGGMGCPNDPFKIGEMTDFRSGDNFKGTMDEVALYNRELTLSEIQQHYRAGIVSKGYCTNPAEIPTQICGDGIIETGEQCDDGNNVIGDGCSALCGLEQCDPGMVSYWSFNSGNANDALGRNNGTPMNGATATATGQVGQAFGFDGVDDYIKISAPMSSWFQNSKSSFTVEAWVYLSELNRRNFFFNLQPGAEINIAVDYGDSGKSNMLRSYTTQGLWYYSGGVTFEANKWYHIAVVYDGSYRTHYINGIVDGTPLSATGTIAGNVNTDLKLGQYGDFLWLKGKLDEVAIYNRSLTADEVSQLYQISSQGFGYCAQVCSPNTNEPCYTGAAGTSGVGLCHNGTRTCNAYGVWNACVGDVTPINEVCDGLNNDCDMSGGVELIDEQPLADQQTLGMCPMQLGVCNGAKKTCTAGVWKECTSSDYKSFNSSYADLEGNVTWCWDNLDNDCNNLADKYDSNCDPAQGGVTLPACSVLDMLDLNGDNSTTIQDAIWIIRKIVGYGDPITTVRNCNALKVV